MSVFDVRHDIHHLIIGVRVSERNGVSLLKELGRMKISLLFEEALVPDALRDHFANFLISGIGEDDVIAAEYEALIDSGNESDETGRRLLKAASFCQGDVALTLLELCVLRAVEPETGQLIDLVAPGNGSGVTVLTAARTAGYMDNVDEALLSMADARAGAECLLLSCGGKREADYQMECWRADPYLLDYLAGGNLMDALLGEFVHRFDPGGETITVFGFDDEAVALGGKIRLLLSGDESLVVVIEGERGQGRFTCAKRAAQTAGLRLLSVDFAWLREVRDPSEVMRRLVRVCALEERALCVRGITEEQDSDKARDILFLLKKLERCYAQAAGLPLFLLTEPGLKPAPWLSGRFLSMKIPTDPVVELAIWKGFLADEDQEMVESVASRMRLTAGQVERVAQAVKTAREVGETVNERAICRMCYTVLDDGRYSNVKWVRPGFLLADLKIDARNRAILTEIADQVRHRRRVYDDWNLRSRYAYGRCVSVILAGPPGTGKTMAVHALASGLSLELYKVDLSQIVDKYVGETEKRLEEVFTRAEKSNMILFFDEADAVMGKRSEVKDAQDKYANTEISFILQRIEEFDGIVMLATNNLQNIDQAFMRRIRYVLSFERPDVSTREEIWRSAFGDGVPLDRDIDFPYLAETFDLSGGEIKNVVLNAVFYGASDGGSVGMRHIMKSLKRESQKLKRGVNFDGDLGKYSYLVGAD